MVSESKILEHAVSFLMLGQTIGPSLLEVDEMIQAGVSPAPHGDTQN